MKASRTRTLPHNEAAEAGLIGAMLLSPVAIEQADDAGITAASFYTPALGVIYDAILGLHAKTVQADPVTVGDELDQQGLLADLRLSDTLNGVPALIHLQATCPVISNAPSYARIVARDARARHALHLASNVAEAVYERCDDWETAIMDILATSDADLTVNPQPLFTDIEGVMSNVTEIVPTVAVRSDGLMMLYPSRINGIVGPPESQKSMLAQWWCFEEIRAGNNVFYLDFEDDVYGVLERMRGMGATDEMLIEHFGYVMRDEAWTTSALQRLYRALGERKPTLCIVDGVTKAMGFEGYKINDNDDAAKFMSGIPSALRKHGAAVLTVDHIAKNADPLQRGGIGAQHKLAAIDGVLLKMKPESPFGRGRTGVGELLIDKDRPGQLRGKAAMGKLLARVTFRSEKHGEISVDCEAPSTKMMMEAHQMEVQRQERQPFRATGYQQKISLLFEKLALDAASRDDDDGEPVLLSGRAIQANVKGNAARVRKSIKDMAEDGVLKPHQGGNRGGGVVYSLVRPYRDPLQELLSDDDAPVDDDYGDGELGEF